jgi:nitrate/TMAO reductase-like tetraheme cytochrome c subunit
MNRTKLLVVDRAASLFLAAAVILLAGLRASAQNVQHLSMTYEGGMPGSNVVTGVTLVTNAVKVTGVKVTWDGPSGYYQLFESPGTNDPVWVALTRRNILARTATVPARYSNAFFQVSGPSPLYAGSETCAECHAPVLNTEIHTLHAVAFSNALFEADGGQTNSSCLACHTVGFDMPTGFVSQTETPHLASVQCENCHGPAAPHAANPDNPAVRPRAEVASQVCGGCHNGPRHPTFDEWTNSAHALVTNLLVTNFNAAHHMLVTNLNLNAANQINHCGRCHSGSVRLSLLETNALPTGDANIGIVCASCHDPHQTNAYPAQLRNPIASTNDYFMPTNGTFAKLYNPEINICAQCHNHAGASWTNNACEPHHSLQYNMYLGTIGELESGTAPLNPHALVTNQCVGCHMQTTPFVSDVQPATNGHSFKVETYAVCLNCHDVPESFFPTIVAILQEGFQTTWIDGVTNLLDTWAATKAPPTLAKYGNLAWEYTTPGSLSSGGPGPDAKEQLLIPENIRKARFNLYVVQNDGSISVHNPEYAVTLLSAAEDWIQEELDQ